MSSKREVKGINYSWNSDDTEEEEEKEEGEKEETLKNESKSSSSEENPQQIKGYENVGANYYVKNNNEGVELTDFINGNVGDGDVGDDDVELLNETKKITQIDKIKTKFVNTTSQNKGLIALAIIVIILMGYIFYSNLTYDCPIKPLTNHEIKIDEITNNFIQSTLSIVDKKIDPCESMYEYSCSKWFNDINETDFMLSFDTLEKLNSLKVNEILNKNWPIIGDYYSSCVNNNDKSDFADILIILSKINTISNIDNYITSINSIKKDYGLNLDIFYDIYVDIDLINNTRFMININEPSLFLPSNYEYKNDTFKKEYLKWISDIITKTEFGMNENSSLLIAEEIYNYEKNISQFLLLKDDYYDPYKILNIFNLTFIESTDINLYNNIVNLFNTNVDGSSLINIINPELFNNSKYFYNLDMKTVKYYLKIKAYFILFDMLPENYHYVKNDYYKLFYNITVPIDKEEYCKSFIKTNFNEILNKYFNEYYSGINLSDFINLLVSSYKNINNKYFDKNMNSFLKDKINNLEFIIGELDIKNQFLKDYENLNIKINYEKQVINYFNLNKLKINTNLNLLNSFNNKSNYWPYDSTVVNAWYNPSFNRISIPNGILDEPFYYDEKELYVFNIPKIGSVIAHELSHMIDNDSRKYDSNGNLIEEEDLIKSNDYNNYTFCLTNLYNQNQIFNNTYQNGKQTLNENIADNLGMLIINDFYLKWINENKSSVKKINKIIQKINNKLNLDKLFYISYAQNWCKKTTNENELLQNLYDVHSTSKFRVDTVLYNNQNFLDTFKCKTKPSCLLN